MAVDTERVIPVSIVKIQHNYYLNNLSSILQQSIYRVSCQLSDQIASYQYLVMKHLMEQALFC